MFVNRSGRNKHLYRRPSIDASYQVLIHLAKRFQRRRFFRHRLIRNKNCRWQPCLLTDRDKMSIFIEDLSQMPPTMFRFIWPCGYRGEDFQKLTNQKQELPVVPMFVHESGRYDQLFLKDLPQTGPTKFRFIWPSGFRGEEF